MSIDFKLKNTLSYPFKQFRRKKCKIKDTTYLIINLQWFLYIFYQEKILINLQHKKMIKM